MLLKELDWLGSLSDLISNIFYVKINPLAWPISIVAFLLDIVLYFERGLYADTGLNIIYLVLTLYGLYLWCFGGKNRTALPITHITFGQVQALTLVTIFGTIAVDLILRKYTDSRLPFWDAFTAVFSLVGEWLLCKKILQNWLVWFVLNGLYAGIYFYKGIPVHAFLQILYFGFAIVGYFYWRNKMVLAR